MVQAQTSQFGDRLRQLRELAGLTQEELAERAGLSPAAVGALERGYRRKPYPHTLRALSDALALSQEESQALQIAARRQSAAIPSRSLLEPAHRVPAPVGSLVGRDREIADLCGLLTSNTVRLVTLTGPGGMGKTRLALEVAPLLSEDFPDGVVFVALESVQDPELVLAAIADAVGLRGASDLPMEDRLRQTLRDRRALLVLDNFEHLLEAAVTLAELLAACPGQTVLTTSRAPLRLRGEHEYPVQPLGAPPSDREAMRGTDVNDAVELFVQRAQAVRPDFALTEANALTVAQICRRLDGLPLAIELAAARIKLFSADALLTRLENRLALLTGGARDLPDRQRTMRDAIAWSFDLLPEEEQALFRRLGVFVAGITIEAAEAVMAGFDSPRVDVIEGIASLVDKSLLRSIRGADGSTRFGMLETIREYALEQLDEVAETTAARNAHANYFLESAERAEKPEHTRAQVTLMRSLEPEFANVQASLTWLLDERVTDPDRARRGLRLVAAVARFWSVRGFLKEAVWLERALRLTPSELTPERAAVLTTSGVYAWYGGDLAKALSRQEEALAIWRALGDHRAVVRSLWFIGLVAAKRGDTGLLESLAKEAEPLAPQIEVTLWATVPDLLHGAAALVRGDGAAAEAHIARVLEYHQRHDFPWGHAWALGLLAEAAMLERDHATALARYQQSLVESNSHGDVYATLDGIVGVAAQAVEFGQAEAAALLLGAVSATRAVVGFRATWITLTSEVVVERVRARLESADFDQAYTEGHALSLQDAVDLAVSIKPAA